MSTPGSKPEWLEEIERLADDIARLRRAVAKAPSDAIDAVPRDLANTEPPFGGSVFREAAGAIGAIRMELDRLSVDSEANW